MTVVKEPAKIGTVPNQPKTPARAVRIDDETWAAIKAEALRRQLPGGASDVVREALARHLLLPRDEDADERADLAKTITAMRDTLADSARDIRDILGRGDSLPREEEAP